MEYLSCCLLKDNKYLIVRYIRYKFSCNKYQLCTNTCLDQLVRELFQLNQRSRVRALGTQRSVLGELPPPQLGPEPARIRISRDPKMDFGNRVWFTKKKLVVYLIYIIWICKYIICVVFLLFIIKKIIFSDTQTIFIIRKLVLDISNCQRFIKPRCLLTYLFLFLFLVSCPS